jgi:prevent-host-death family protein
MTKIVTAAEANRQFSSLMREVADGETVIVTSHGRNIMKMTAVGEEDETLTERRSAHRRLMEYLRSQPRRPAISWTREELYEDEPYPDTFK